MPIQSRRFLVSKFILQSLYQLNNELIISDGLTRLSTSSPSIRPVIYRYIDVIKDSIALLEAIHFEFFMPGIPFCSQISGSLDIIFFLDRPDLRFLAVPLTSIPSDTMEGDYFHLSDVDLLSNPSFSINLGKVTRIISFCFTGQCFPECDQNCLKYMFSIF